MASLYRVVVGASFQSSCWRLLQIVIIVCSLPLAKNALHLPTRTSDSCHSIPKKFTKFMYVQWARPGITYTQTELGKMTIVIRSITWLKKVGSTVVKESSRVLQKLSLCVWLVMTCSGTVGLSRWAVSHRGHLLVITGWRMSNGCVCTCAFNLCAVWKDGRIEEWKNGRMEEWKNGSSCRTEVWTGPSRLP